MKTKTSKKVLSFILAVMMIVTSIPMFGFVALADAAAATDPAVAEVQDAMDAFEAKLSSAGAFTNVTAAYNAYVDCQKAIDAYVYGGESNALSGKADALNTAINNIGTFTPKTASAVPTFPAWDDDKTEVSAMTQYAGVAYNNVLYATRAESIGSAYAGQAGFQILMSKDITVMYDGSNDTLIPVMLDAYKSNSATPDVNSSDKTAYGKTRYFYAAYPSTATDGSTDDSNFNLVGYWQSAGDNRANWAYNWWYATTKQTSSYNYANYDPAYNAATGYAGFINSENKSEGGKQQTDYRTAGHGGDGMTVDRSGKITSRKYTSVEYYHSNVLKYVGGDISGAGTVATIPYWYGSSGDGANSPNDNKNIAGTSINIVNYKYLTDALMTNGNKMKAVALSDFSEGGLSDYINAMEAATNFDPASYFTSSNNYSGCISAMNTVVNNMNNASVTNKNSTDYADLRTAMSVEVRNTYAAGNTGYTADSWNTFAQKYEAAKAIMAATNDSGYTSTSAATAAAELIEAYNGLQTNVVKVNTDALENAIDTFEDYNKNYFTTASYDAVKAVVSSAKTAVWGSEENYKIPTEAPDDTAEAEALVAEQTQNVLNAVKTLVISPDAVVAIDNGDRYSLNTAYALAATITEPTDYSNYASLATAVNNAKAYEATLADKEFTDLDAQLAEYKTYVNAIIVAYEGLQYSFTKLPDGTVTGVNSASINTLENHKNNNGYNWYTDFSYPGSAVIFKTNHDAHTVPYGNANLTWRINIDNNIDKENNAIDSITINGTADQANINSTSPTSTPPALSDAEKSTYAGCLANNGFSLTNFRVTDSINNRKSSYGTTASGAAVTDRVSATDEYTKILATTEGSGNNPALGAIPLQPIHKGDASITLTGDMNVDIPATTKKTLTSSTVPTKTNYSYTGYFGITYVWNTQPTLAYAGYDYNTSKSNNQSISSIVTVVDMSYLVDLVDQCNALLPESAKYTDQTWEKFLTALEAAQADLNYTGMTGDAILTNVKSRYTNLWSAYSALEVKEFNVTFSYKNSAGNDVSKVIAVTYGDTLSMSKYTTQINSITTPDYVADNYTYTFREWSPNVNLDEAVTADATYVAQYDGTANNADWTAYNSAKQALFNKIQPRTFIAADLEALETSLQGLTYFNYTEEQQATVYADSQTAIDTETATITSLTNNLTPVDKSVYDVEAAIAAAEAGNDTDRYAFSVEPYRTVTVAGDSVEALAYATQAELDAAIQAAMTVKDYTIYLNGTAVTTVAYGTNIIVNSDSTFESDVADTHPNYDGANVAWSYSYSAPSTNGVATNSKYMTTAPSFGFIVKGDTYLTTVEVDDETAGIYTVKFVADLAGNSSKTYAVCYTDSNGTIVNMPEHPTYSYYTFNGYTCTGATLSQNGSSYTVTGDCTITASYTVNTVPTYTISYYNGYTAWSEGASTSRSDYKYNELVSLTGASDAKYWFAGLIQVDESDNMIGEQLYLMAYGSEYSFFACQSFNEDNWNQGVYSGIISLSDAEFKNLLETSANDVYDGNTPFTTFYDGQGNEIKAEGNTMIGYTYPDVAPTVTALDTAVPVYDSKNSLSKISLIGTFVLPEGYKMVETGFLFTTVSGADMTLSNVGKDGIARMKSSKYTVGNQFVINVKAPSDLSLLASFDYVAYAIVKDADGNQIVCYSQQYNGSANNL